MRVRGGKGFAATTALIIILVLVVAGMGGYIFFSRNSVQAEQKEKRNYVVTQENADEVVEQMVERASRDAGSYTATMNSTWHFPDGKSPSTDAYVANSADNKWPVWFDVTLSDGRTVYESPILPVDTYIREFTLDEELPEGTYGGTITYHLVDENQDELSTLSIGITIYVDG